MTQKHLCLKDVSFEVCHRCKGKKYENYVKHYKNCNNTCIRSVHVHSAHNIYTASVSYRIAGNVCGDYILQFVVENKVCGFKVCGLLNIL